MSHTVTSSKTAKREGGFAYECFDYAGNLFRAEGGFETQPEAIAAAERAERIMMMGGEANPPTLDEVLSDDELLKELGIKTS